MDTQLFTLITNNEAGRNTYALRNNAEFVIPRSSCAKVTKMPLIDFPYTWNNTDSSITEISQKNLLKKTVKQELLEKYRDFKCGRLICLSCLNN